MWQEVIPNEETHKHPVIQSSLGNKRRTQTHSHNPWWQAWQKQNKIHLNNQTKITSVLILWLTTAQLITIYFLNAWFLKCALQICFSIFFFFFFKYSFQIYYPIRTSFLADRWANLLPPSGTSRHLNGNPSKRYNFVLKTQKVCTLQLTCFQGLFHQHVWNRSTFLLWIWAPWGTATCVLSLQIKNRRKLACSWCNQDRCHIVLILLMKSHTDCQVQNVFFMLGQ